HSRVLCDRVWRRADLRQQSGSRCRLQEIPLAALKHLRQHGSRGVDMSHEVYIPDALPLEVAHFRATVNSDTGIRAEQVYLPVSLVSLFDQIYDVGFQAHIRREGKAVYLPRDARCAVTIQVRDYNTPRAFRSEAAAKRPPDAGRSACHYCNFVA